MVSNLRDIDVQGHEIDRSILTLSRSSLGMRLRYCVRVGCELGEYHIAKLYQEHWQAFRAARGS